MDLKTATVKSYGFTLRVDGKFAFIWITADDAHLLKKKWAISNGYVVRAGWDRANKQKGTVYLHREIMGAKKGERVYFKDGNKFNCQRENLVLISPKNTSTLPGISWDKLHQKWKVYKMVGRKRRTIGWFADITEAARKLVEPTSEL